MTAIKREFTISLMCFGALSLLSWLLMLLEHSMDMCDAIFIVIFVVSLMCFTFSADSMGFFVQRAQRTAYRKKLNNFDASENEVNQNEIPQNDGNTQKRIPIAKMGPLSHSLCLVLFTLLPHVDRGKKFF